MIALVNYTSTVNNLSFLDLEQLEISGFLVYSSGLDRCQKVSPQYFGVSNYSGCHDQPKGLTEDLSRIIVALRGDFPCLRNTVTNILKKALFPTYE